VLFPLGCAASGRIDLRRTAAGNHAGIGVRPDNGYGMQLGAVERQYSPVIL